MQLIAARAPVRFDLTFGADRKALERFNVERVRSYLERNLGATRKEVVGAHRLNPRTVAKAILKIRAEQRECI